MKGSRNFAAFGRFLATVLAALCANTYGAVDPPQYTVLDLGPLLYGQSHATGVNDRGMVTGLGQFRESGAEHAFLYSDGVMHDLGSVGESQCFGQAINNRGQVAGNYEPPGFVGDRPFFAEIGSFTPLGTLGGTLGEATGITLGLHSHTLNNAVRLDRMDQMLSDWD